MVAPVAVWRAAGRVTTPLLSSSAPPMPVVAPSIPAPLAPSLAPIQPPIIRTGVFSSDFSLGPVPLDRGSVVRTGEFSEMAVSGQVVWHGTAKLGSFGTAQLPVAARASEAVRTGGFANAPIQAAPVARPAPRVVEPSFSPVEIVFKPRPAYTEEARRLRLEGEVVLEALFGGSGEIRILRVIQSLGHGLDENAVEAARQIRFRPAQSDGRAIDSAATVHITFRLAYK